MATSIARLLLVCGVGSILFVSGCERKSNPDGTETITGAPDPSKDGDYKPVTINGKCYLSNGTWCIPCDGGVEVRCSTLGTPQPAPEKPAPGGGTNGAPRGGPLGYKYLGPADQGPSDVLLTSFKQMTGGLEWRDIPAAYGMETWIPGQPLQSDFALNEYDPDSDTVDVTYLGEHNDLTPNPGRWIDASGHAVLVEILYAGGDPNDNVPDPIGVRIRGERDTVADILSSVFTSLDAEVTLEEGTFSAHYDGGPFQVQWNGITVYER